MSKALEKLQKTGKPLSFFSYMQLAVKCGKIGCKRCPHGPYWYARWRDGERVRAIYIGRHLPTELKEYAIHAD